MLYIYVYIMVTEMQAAVAIISVSNCVLNVILRSIYSRYCCWVCNCVLCVRVFILCIECECDLLVFILGIAAACVTVY